MSEIGDRLSAKLAEVRTAVETALASAASEVSTKIDELQVVVDEANAKIDELQGQTGT